MSVNKLWPIIEHFQEVQRNVLNKARNDTELIKKIVKNCDMTGNSLNYLLVNGGAQSLPLRVHALVLRKIIHNAFFRKLLHIDSMHKYFFCFKENPLENQVEVDLSPIQDFSYPQILDLLEKLHTTFLNTKFELKNGLVELKFSKHSIKGNGAVYTPNGIVDEIVTTALKNRLGVKYSEGDIVDLKILDLACGTGRFYFSALHFLEKCITKKGADSRILRRQLISSNLYGIDSDPIAIDILKIQGMIALDDFSLDAARLLSLNIVCKDMLIQNEFAKLPLAELDAIAKIKSKATVDEIGFDRYLAKKEEAYLQVGGSGIVYPIEFPEIFAQYGGFDAIVSNPPYVLLKVNKKDKDASLQEYYAELKKRTSWEVNYFRKSCFYEHSVEGMLNYYRLSVELAIKLLNQKGELGIICPSTLFGDLSARGLRRFMILKNTLREVTFFPESSRLFDCVSQSVAIFYLRKCGTTENILVKVQGKKETLVDVSLLRKSFGAYEVPPLDGTGWRILEKLNRLNKIKNIKSIRNRRGEFDLTLYKRYLTAQETPYPLVRGNSIKKNWKIDEGREYVLPQFLSLKSKEFHLYDFKKMRIVGQQISNADLKKRLNFALVNGSHVLANSCNYLSLTSPKLLPELFLAYLNSYLLNWRFKITSTNNHVNNYELAELPVPTESSMADSIIKLARNYSPEKELELNLRIMQNYGLTFDEIEYVLSGVYDKHQIACEYEKVMKHGQAL